MNKPTSKPMSNTQDYRYPVDVGVAKTYWSTEATKPKIKADGWFKRLMKRFFGGAN